MSDQQSIKTWPERIYLQHGDLPEVPAFHDVHPGNGYSDNVTWCQDRIEPVDVEYVRADVAAPTAPVRITGELLHATYPASMAAGGKPAAIRQSGTTGLSS